MTTFVFALFLMQRGCSTSSVTVGDSVPAPTITSMPGWYQTIHARLQWEDSLEAKKDVMELAEMYEQHPETRFLITMLLSDINCRRAQPDTADIYQPIVPTLIAHLFDSDNKGTRFDAMRVLSNLRPSPPFEILEPAIKLSYWETFPAAVFTPLHIAAMFCKQSKQAIFALRDAVAPDQPPEKKVWAFQNIAEAGRLGCRDTELVDAVLQGLRSDPVAEATELLNPAVSTTFMVTDTKRDPVTNQRPPNVVAAAIRAAAAFGSEAEPLKKDLERIAADKSHPLSATTAKVTLEQLLNESAKQ